MYSPSVQALVDELGRLPGVGPKSAQRIALHVLSVPREDALRLSSAISIVKERVTWCHRCFNMAESRRGGEPGGDGAGPPECDVCRDSRRDPTLVCVVESAAHVIAIEKSGMFHGRYHVLQGAINPLAGIGVDQVRIKELLERVGREEIKEVILATSPTTEGEHTAMYLKGELKDMPVRLSDLARGLPFGGDLEHVDELTLGRALEDRREYSG